MMNRNDIMKKLLEKEQESEFKKRCFKQKMCPICGGDLTTQIDRNGITDANCSNCIKTWCY
jgi:hypothetical protein